MKNLFKSMVVGTTLVSQLLVASPALAQTPNSTPIPSLTHPLEGERCERLQEKLKEKIEKYQAKVREYKVHKYTNFKDRLHKINQMLNDRGQDTTQLEEYMQVFDDKANIYGESLDAFIKKLESANDFVCGESEGKFKGMLDEAKELLRVVRQNGSDVKDYFQNTIRPEVNRLRDQHPSPTPAYSIHPSASVIPLPSVN